MVKLWRINDNSPIEWQKLLQDHVRIENGKKNITSFCNAVQNSKLITVATIPEKDPVNNSQIGNTKSFIDKVSTLLNYKEGQHINTIDVYQHPEYSIQAMYILDNDSTNSTNLNHFATIVNTEYMKIFESAVFYKIQEKTTVELPIEDLMNVFVNFYYVNGLKLVNGVFEKISCNNYVPEIKEMFKSYKTKNIHTWVVLAETNEMLDKINESDNTIDDLNNVIWFKVKEYHGDLIDIMSTLEHNKASDYRGVFMDIDERFIKKVFF